MLIEKRDVGTENVSCDASNEIFGTYPLEKHHNGAKTIGSHTEDSSLGIVARLSDANGSRKLKWV